MKAVILAGGMGTRLSEETLLRPKPMVEIGGKPILWHILKLYACFGVNDFILCLGYRGYMIKEYFANYFLHNSDVTFDLKRNTVKIHQNLTEPWTVTLVDTGEAAMTGGRLKRVRSYLADDEDFCFTYGDGLADVDIAALIRFHREHPQALVTVTAVQNPGRFGSLDMDGAVVRRFEEKPHGDGGWINGGFFVVHPAALDRIEGDHTPWEKEPLQRLASEGRLAAFRHRGFFRPMDTLRDKESLEALWQSGQAPWRLWD